VTLADSLRHVIAIKDSLLQVAATRSIQITTPTPQVTVSLTPDHWWNTPLVGGALAFVAGMLTPIFISVLDRRAQRRRMTQVLGAELGIFQFRMIGTCLTIARRLRRLDAALFARLRAAITPRLETADLMVTRGMIDRLVNLPPEALAAWQTPPPGPTRGLTLRRYDLPYLDSTLTRLDLLRPPAQELLFQLRGSLNLFNQHVDDVLRYHWLTFETLENQNRAVVEQNISTTLQHAFDQALRIVTCVTQVLGEPDFTHITPSRVQVEPPPVDLAPAQ
jgi:hypothetical protein